MKGGGELECKNVLDSYIGCGGGKKAAPGPATQHACASWICTVAACGVPSGFHPSGPIFL